MSHAIEFIETSFFTKQIQSIATQEELRTLQNELIAWPDKGDIIQGTVVFAKLGWQQVIKEKVQVYGLFIS